MGKIKALTSKRYGSLSSPRGRGSLGSMGDGDPWASTKATAEDAWSMYNPLALITAGASAVATAISGATAGAAEAAATQTFASGNSISMADFKTVGGVCKPLNFPALGYVKTMQQQMNRVAQVKGFSKIGVDGAVGPGTLALLVKIQQASAGEVMGNTSSCIYVAGDADVIGEQVKSYADSLGAPAQVSGPPAVPAIVTQAGLPLAAPPGSGVGASVSGAFSGMTGGQKALLAGMTGGIGFLLYKKMKKGKRGKRG